MRSGGQVLADQLALHGVEFAFGVPGESYLALLDALLDVPVRFVQARHEAGAANMAEAYGKLTGRPGVCMVTRGPGATQASVGVHTAFQDGTPLVLLIGQVPRAQMEREAFQEIDYRRMFGPLSKWVAQIDDPARIPELVARAFRVATSGRPGPVVLALPEDVLVEEVEVADARPFVAAQAAPNPDTLHHVRALLEGAERPLAIVGGRPWSDAAHARFAAWCGASGIPVAAAWRCQDYVDNLADCYAGHLGVAQDAQLTALLLEADALLVVGTRLGDIETQGYATLAPPAGGPSLIHVHPSPEELGRVYEPTLGIVSAGPRSRRHSRRFLRSAPARAAPGCGPRTMRTSGRSGRASCLALSISRASSRCFMRASPRTRSSQAGPETSPSGRTASGLFGERARNSRPRAERWGMACRPRSRRNSSTRSGSWSASRATATS